jgi:hypothetical protein
MIKEQHQGQSYLFQKDDRNKGHNLAKLCLENNAKTNVLLGIHHPDDGSSVPLKRLSFNETTRGYIPEDCHLHLTVVGFRVCIFLWYSMTGLYAG